MNIYLVTDGEYSDYRVMCACSTKEKAKYAKKFYVAEYIEEYELDALPDHPAGMFWYSVQMDRDGNSRNIEPESGVYGTSSMDWCPYGDGETVGFSMWATNERHAVKVANERRAQLIASGEWTTDWNVWKERLEERA